MSYLNKEQILPTEQGSAEEVALREVETYIEKVERSTEHTVSDNNQTQQSQPQPQTQQTPQVVSKQNDGRELKKIFLPLDESFLGVGLKYGPESGIKWLAEWCLMMIKKYPGRVFYSSTNGHD